MTDKPWPEESIISQEDFFAEVRRKKTIKDKITQKKSDIVIWFWWRKKKKELMRKRLAWIEMVNKKNA